ncbi:hypothetical protein [Nostoc sp. 2RC]|uniref:hypothetical protein n=1 Tax=Nostoc sp. 2RC TaxID=2485484 RepID=UPI001628FF89|nr:hypothetical protein [Nostoc sp. 2RC]MBC1240212.1 hypothetical protein [Nostoc sp. 2RC]
MNINQSVPIFTELINEQAAVVSGGAIPIFVYDDKTPKILNADGHGKEVILAYPTPSPSPEPDNSIGSQLWFPVGI